MAKASPARNNFNAGEFSVLVGARTDLDKYPASMRSMRNVIATPQGPAMSRGGTYFEAEAYDHTKYSTLAPFVVSESDALQLEFSHLRVRFIFPGGVQSYTPVAVTSVTQANPMIINAAGLGAAIGDQVGLNGFTNTDNVNGRTFKVLAVAGSLYTLDFSYTGALGAKTGHTAGRIYHIVSPYSDVDARKLRVLQDQNVMYLFCPGYRPRTLSRVSAYNWVIAIEDYYGGPFMQEGPLFGTLTPDQTGNRLTTGFGTATVSGGTAASALDLDNSTYWDSASNQTGTFQFQFTVPRTVNGYVLYVAQNNSDTSYAAKDYAPATWFFQGSNDAVTWFTLDQQTGFIAYGEGRSVLFPFNNTTAYSYYRWAFRECTRNGPINIRVERFLTTELGGITIQFTLSGNYTDLNGGAGFLPTDVGRMLRVKSNDGSYRTLRINFWVSSTVITAALLDEPLYDMAPILQWSPGYFSDGTGWPTVATFFEDRLCVSGVSGFPGLVACSRTGAYNDFQQKTATDVVLDDSALVFTVKSRKISQVRWLESDERGLLIGTGSGETIVASTGDNALTARTARVRGSTQRGSADIEPVKVERSVLFCASSRRTIYQMSYVFETDGYKTPSMSLFASHLGVPQFAQGRYQAEPHSIVWYRRDDGSVVGLTYNPDQNVSSWHQHHFGGVIESISVIPYAVDIQDSLWMVIKRTVNGEDRRYIERLTRFWDFDSTLEHAHYVDSGLRYEGASTSLLYGLSHLEGETLQGLLNDVPYEDLVVENGQVVLPIPVTRAILGLAYEAFGEISNMEAGAADGTAQGKMKRTHNCVLSIWDSYYGEIGTYDEQAEDYKWNDIEYKERFDELEPITLQTQMTDPITMPEGYGQRGSIAFRQLKPLPFNLIALFPQMHTQDR